jgi:phosphonate transport system substrate-binding protein
VLTITTCQAANTFAVTHHLADYLSAQLGMAVRCVDDVSWEERYRLLDAGEIDVGWICGLPYTVRANQPDAQLELLAAPVMVGARYEARPFYFSDVIVPADSPYQQFLDLRGASWAYNEVGSHSGYNVTYYYLAQLGESSGFFGQAVASGGHMLSLQMVVAGHVDASAIDSTVLAWALAQRPSLAPQLRIIATIGPSPIPPLVIQKHVPTALANQIRTLLLGLHEHEDGRRLLASGDLLRFTAVTDKDYDPIRHMTQQASTIQRVS